MRVIYLKHSTTAPLDPRLREGMLPLLDEDPRAPGGLLADGRHASRLIEEAREKVASFCGASASEIVFTSGGTEANNMALKGVAWAGRQRGGRIVVAATEHSSVLYPARSLAKQGCEMLEVPVDRCGVVDLNAVEQMTKDGAVVISVAAATAETGTLQPVEQVARVAHDHGALLHVDACLAAAHIDLDVKRLGADLASFSAHKMGGPRGAGALYVRDGVRIAPLIEGETQEGGRRGGTPYVAGAWGLGEACRLTRLDRPDSAPRIEELGEMLQEALARVPGVTLNGHPERRLKGLVSVSVQGVEGEALLLKLAAHGIAASSGSACYDQTGKPSHVLLASGVPPDLARGSVLFASGRDTAREEILQVIELFPRAVAELRALSAPMRAAP